MIFKYRYCDMISLNIFESECDCVIRREDLNKN